MNNNMRISLSFILRFGIAGNFRFGPLMSVDLEESVPTTGSACSTLALSEDGNMI